MRAFAGCRARAWLLVASVGLSAGTSKFTPTARAQQTASTGVPEAAVVARGKPDLVVKGEVHGHQGFEQEIGRGLLFRLVRSPESYGQGWDIEVAPKQRLGGFPEYASVATPPYHLYKPTYLNASYGVSAAEAVAINPRRFQFVETAPGSQAASVVVETVAYSLDWRADQPKLEQEALKIAVGLGELSIVNSHITPGRNREDLGSIDRLKFEVKIWLDSGFTLRDVLFGAR